MPGVRTAYDWILEQFFRVRPPRRDRLDVLIFLAWTGVVAWQAAHHAMWRDEVRALSFALSGDSVAAMLQGIHGEGHPALWYLLLRTAHDVFGSVLVLPGLAFVIAACAVALLIFRSPFPRALVLCLVFGRGLVFEYSVMARNYGIAALILFAVAALYPANRTRGVVLGVLLFLLANTNMVAAVLALAFLAFWFLDLHETGEWSRSQRVFLANAWLTLVGVALCGLTVLPTFNDAAASDLPWWGKTLMGLWAIVDPADTGVKLLPVPGWSLVLFGGAAVLLPRRSALVAALASLLAVSVMLRVGTTGVSYRHSAVWLSFLVTLYWICWPDVCAWRRSAGSLLSGWRRSLAVASFTALVLLFAAEAGLGLANLYFAAFPETYAWSRSAELGRFIAGRKDLSQAILVCEPDHMAEALPYYLGNRLYMVRSGRFGTLPKFTRSGPRDVDLGQVLAVSRALQRRDKVPVVIVLQYRLDEIVPGEVYRTGYNWTFRASLPQLREFRAATIMLRRFAPARSDESYDVYLLT